jgi:hypothetical protein
LELSEIFRKLVLLQNTKGKTMDYLDMFDEDFIDPIDKWIEENNADIKKVKSVSYRKVKQLLEQDYVDENNA